MHQLFILPSLSPKGDQLSVSNVPELIGQLRKVLRLKIGDTIFLQSEEPEKEGGILRYVFKISSWTDKDLEGEILATEKIPLSLPINQDCLLLAPYKREVAMLVALPNKREKAELIVQKLSEIGVEEILFRPAERSVIKQRNEKKAERLRKISKEAVEQSRGSSLPKLGWCENLKAFCTGKKVLVFDKGGEELSYDWKLTLVWVVGPEGGLTLKDYENFAEAQVVGLWDTVLRMETASIIWAWVLKNML